MTPSDRHPWFEALARPFIGHTLRSRFHAVWVSGAEHLASVSPDSGVLVCANHTNWWDGFVLWNWFHDRREQFARSQFLAMEEENLLLYKQLSCLGAFGLELRDKRKLLVGMRHAVRLLKTPGNLVWMFPQGVVRAPFIPVEVRPGATVLSRLAGAPILPAILRYEWLVESRPSVFLRFGPALPPGSPPEILQAAMRELFDSCTQEIAELDFTNWERTTRPSLSINKWWDRLRWRWVGGGRDFEEFNR